jgi:VCBS repeat-containing protein
LTLAGALPAGISQSQAVVGGQLVLTLSGTATGADYSIALSQVRFSSTSDNPGDFGTSTSRTITVVANDGTANSPVATATIAINAIDDGGDAQPDAGNTDEGNVVSGNVFADNGSGADSDPDGPPLAVSAVNGSGANVGVQITLASGALLTLNANGTFTYNPNGAFDTTPTAGSGASNTPAQDSFTYTLAGGGTATVTLTITGLDGNDVLLGTAGDDVLAGGVGDDTYFVDNVGDVVSETVGQGRDVVYASTSYGLTAGSSVEVLSTVGLGDTTAINLYGNELGNVLYGNAGANALIGGGGADYLVGFGGDDDYYVDNVGDVVLEAAGQGRDVVYASTSYALTAGSSVEVLSTVGLGDTTAIGLTGNELANVLYGNAGANVLNGGEGNDYLQGFGGADTFAFTTALGAGNVDTIADFLSATDKIALDDAVFTGLGLGGLPPSVFHIGTEATDEDQRIIYDDATGQLYYDADGSGAEAAVLFATVDPGTIITAGDFTVI